MAERGYIQARPPSAHPGILDLWEGSQAYRFDLLTAHLDEKNTTRPRPQTPHTHDVYHIVLFTQGQNEFLLNDRILPSQPGTVALSSPGQGHSFYPRITGSTAYHEVTFALESTTGPFRSPFADLLSYYVGRTIDRVPLVLQLSPGQLRSMGSLYERLLEDLEHTEPIDWLGAYRSVLDILTFIARRVTDTTSLEPQDDPLSNVCDYIDRHYTQRLTLPDLAGRAHMSEAHFCRAFKTRYGIAPIAYQQELRIAAARNLLLSTDLRCKEIARRLGYADVYCFSKAFKKHTGQSPSKLRRG